MTEHITRLGQDYADSPYRWCSKDDAEQMYELGRQCGEWSLKMDGQFGGTVREQAETERLLSSCEDMQLSGRLPAWLDGVRRGTGDDPELVLAAVVKVVEQLAKRCSAHTYEQRREAERRREATERRVKRKAAQMGQRERRGLAQ